MSDTNKTIGRHAYDHYTLPSPSGAKSTGTVKSTMGTRRGGGNSGGPGVANDNAAVTYAARAAELNQGGGQVGGEMG